MFIRPASRIRLAVAAAVVATTLPVSAALAGDTVALPCPGCLLVPDAALPPSSDAAPVDFGWSFGLRGGIVRDSDGTHYEGIALPSLSLSQQAIRGGYSLSGNAELSVTDGDNFRIDQAGLDASVDYALDAVTSARLAATLNTTEDAPHDDIARASGVTTGTATASVTRDLGPLSATLRAGASRTVNGETLHLDGSSVDNSEFNTTALNAGGRLALPLTPVVSAFVDAEVASERYDVASPTLLVKFDNRTYQGSVGLSGKWNDTLSLEGSIGLVSRQFADASLSDVTAVIYSASATYKPTDTIKVDASLSAALDPPNADCGCTADMSRKASVEASYVVNSWLRLRGSASASQSGAVGSDPSTSKWEAGVGADYLLNTNTDLTADYTFARSKTGTAAVEDTQTLMVGVTVHR